MALSLQTIRSFFLGKARDPLSPEARRHITLAAFLAWVGLGADGLSSSCYGPAEAFVALGSHNHLALYLAVLTAATVFIIALAYNQVIELFPSGGGGYKVASQLLGPYAGLVSGAALIVDYVLTITISIAAGMDALFSLLPLSAQGDKLSVEYLAIIFLIALNLRGMKESIKVLLPIFIGFFISHLLLIGYGVITHASHIPQLIPDTLAETTQLSHQLGWVAVAAFFLKAYSLGGGTYTGLEAVSNNVNMLAEPRVRTGKLTMFYMALSLSLTAGGIILLYLLWGATPVEGKTLNAVVFSSIMTGWQNQEQLLILVLFFEAGLLVVAANTGFLAGPTVLANMAVDSWVPHQFRHLSSRLVTQNGIFLFGIAALAILWWSRGAVELLVVLYSINVFLTFALSLLGLSVYWWRNPQQVPFRNRWKRFALSALGFAVTGSILLVTLIEKFGEGGWLTVLITGFVIVICLFIKKHYLKTEAQLDKADELFAETLNQSEPITSVSLLQPEQPTAVFFVGKNRGAGIHTLLWVQRLFPNQFKNFVFISVGEVDSGNLGGAHSIKDLQQELNDTLVYYVNWCHHHGLAATTYSGYATDIIAELVKLAEEVGQTFPNAVFFSTKLIFSKENWITRLLHNETAISLQNKLHFQGKQMVILPMRV